MTLERQGLKALLDRFEDLDLYQATQNPAWLCVDLIPADGDPRFDDLQRFAIWRHTGNVYRVDEYGAAEDDPFIEIALLDRRPSGG